MKVTRQKLWSYSTAVEIYSFIFFLPEWNGIKRNVMERITFNGGKRLDTKIGEMFHNQNGLSQSMRIKIDSFAYDEE